MENKENLENAENVEVTQTEQPAKTKKKMTKKQIIYYVLLVTFASVFIFSGIYIIRYSVLSNRANTDNSDPGAILESILKEMSNDPSYAATMPTINIDDLPDNPNGEKKILPEYAPIYALNNDLVGWIRIEGTKVNWPVMQTDVTNPDYYLKRTFSHTWSDWGAIYVREVCDVFSPSDNLTIYGHHMLDGSMFTAVAYYRDQSFYEAHRTFTFDTIYEHHTYEVFAVFRTSGNYGEGYPYHMFVDARSQAEYDKFVADVKGMAFFETGITPQYGEKLICLSTCEYTLNNGRLVVVARRIS